MTTTNDKPIYSSTPPTEPGWYWLKWPMHGLGVVQFFGGTWVVNGRFYIRLAPDVLFGPKIEPPPKENDT